MSDSSDGPVGVIVGVLLSVLIYNVAVTVIHYIERTGHLESCVKNKWVEPAKCLELFGADR